MRRWGRKGWLKEPRRRLRRSRVGEAVQSSISRFGQLVQTSDMIGVVEGENVWRRPNRIVPFTDIIGLSWVRPRKLGIDFFPSGPLIGQVQVSNFSL